MEQKSCNINDKNKSCCSSDTTDSTTNISDHWNKIYTNSPEEKLGWYESELKPTLKLIDKINLKKSARILNVGAGSTTLVDKLMHLGYKNIIASDLSKVALDQLKKRVNSNNITYIIDDLTQPKLLKNIPPVDLWIDRAVLHFFTEPNDQDTYFNLLNEKINAKGYALFAEYNLNGATVCAGLPVKRYNNEILAEKLENKFKLIDSFDHTYIMPSGAERPYVYTLFQKL